MTHPIPIVGYINPLVADALRDPTSGINVTQLRAERNGPVSAPLVLKADADAEIARLQEKQPHYDRMVQENGELKLAVARLQKPEFYGTESQDTGSDDVSSLFDFCENNEVIEVNGYRCVSTQFGFFDGFDVHLYNSEAEAVSEAKAMKGPEA